jgi:phospholipid-binding lipoprotein MlaA
MFAFNDAIDRAVLLPVATAYRDHVPRLVRRGIDNFLGNLGDIWTTVNEFLQFKIRDGFEMGTRVVANTTMGLGGLLDPATEMRLFKRREDFGQTLGRWGFGDGPYLVLPLLGPFTLRDAFAEPVDLYAGASTWLIDGQTAQISYTTVNVVNTRANLIGTSEFIEGAAIDKYSFTRDAYLARRRNLVYDGNPPPEPFIDEGASDPADAASAPAEAASAPAQ